MKNTLDPTVRKVKKHRPVKAKERPQGKFTLPVQRDVKTIAAILRRKINGED